MTLFGYIDESGTKDDQEIMTVALVLFDGAYVAHRLHKELVKQLLPNKKNSSLHYADITDKNLKLSVAEVLAMQSVQCFTACFYHDGTEKSHNERFDIYTSLIKLCLADALEIHEHLDVSIAQQGGWNTYSGALTNELNEIVCEKSARFGFRKATFSFKPAAKPGIQFADFYAGATRGHLLKHRDLTLGAPFDLVAHQIREIRTYNFDFSAKAKG